MIYHTVDGKELALESIFHDGAKQQEAKYIQTWSAIGFKTTIPLGWALNLSSTSGWPKIIGQSV